MPPLHPRCRCTISYREVEAPKSPQSNKPRGLAAGNEIYFDEGGKLPYKVGEIDFNDASQVKQVLDWVEAQIVTAPVENAIIITQSGEIYHCTGGLNTLTTIEELGEKLRGAIVTHNHPIGSANEYSFSEADWNLFKKFNLYRLRGIDEFFIYELNRNATDLDEMEIIIDNYNYKHWDNMRKARNYKYGYRRWRR